jgi:tRNA nucleotidyltransferase (CCA-adding enzyme)
MSEVQSKLVINPENSKPLLIAEALENYLGTAEWALLRRVAVIAEGEGKALFLVGGSVRDFLLGIRGNFPDLAYEGNAIELAELVSNKLGGSLVRYKTFMTATWDLGMIKEDVAKILKVDPAALPEAIDFTSTRSERYPNAGALPKVKGSDIGADLQRRDFSINAIALRLDGTHVGEIIALEGAFVDLEQGLLRILHEKSFEDDATRMLRILRFGGRLGFELADATRKILKQSLHFLADISGERIRNELDLALAEESWSSILDQMEEIELLKAIHPKLQFKDESKRALDFYKAIESDSGWGISMIHEHWLPMTIWLMPCKLATDKQLRSA